MVTPPRLVSAILLAISLLLIGCEPDPVGGAESVSSTPVSGSDSASGSGLELCNLGIIAKLLPKDWAVVDKIPLDSQCVVSYHFDVPTGGSKIAPVGGLVYRRDHNRPMDIRAYPLNLPGGPPYLGEHRVGAWIADVLSEVEGSELVIEDTNEDDIIVEASIFSWRLADKPAESVYESRGWFLGDGGVTVGKDKVTVLVRRPGTRSQLADRKVLRPRDKKSYYKKDSAALVDPETVDLVSLVVPADPATSEYPEKPVLAFYENLPLTDTNKISSLIGPETSVPWLARNSAALGCLTDPQFKVFVQDLDTRQAPAVPLHTDSGKSVITDTVTVTALCMLNGNGTVKRTSVISWLVRWEEATDRWQLIQAKP
jgi:hypothetical protein